MRREFIDRLGKLDLKEELAGVSDTYIGKDYEKAAKGMERQINKKVPELKLVAPCLSIRVEGMKGPIAERELSKCKEFGFGVAKKISNRA